MAVILLLMAIAGIVGFLLAVYLFFYRIKPKLVWRWLGGIIGGTILGTFMALLVLFMLWPPTEDFMIAGGLALIAILIIAILDYPKITCCIDEEAGELRPCTNNN